MYEKTKLSDAWRQYDLMITSKSDRQDFEMFLRSFITTARSVLQYAQRESKSKVGGPAWFSVWMADALVKFFRDKRNLDIHERPMIPNLRVAMSINARASSSASIEMIVRDAEGNIKKQTLSSTDSIAVEPESAQESTIARTYHFADWTGPEDVLQLCHQYLTQLSAVVQDGIAKGFLTP